MARRWILRPQQLELANQLARTLDVHPVVGQLLTQRRLTSVDECRQFLDRRLSHLHDPELLPGAGAAADLLHSACKNGRKICVYGDYDVDGMSSSAILLDLLRLAGADPRFYVPDRFEEGYGVNCEALAKLQGDGVEVVVTVDCGVASTEAADHARQLGLTYIVTDHHEFGPTLPAAAAIVHPRLPGASYPFGELCGAGVAFKLAWELARRFSGSKKTSDLFQGFLLRATGLAALATVCDMVPLVDENRILVHHGLQALRSMPGLGLAALMQAAEIKDPAKLSVGDLAFAIGPRLNACGRLGTARLGVELLSTTDPQRAAELARYLDGENKNRQTIERRMFSEACKLVEAESDVGGPIVLAQDGWHAGVIGVVASKVVERFHRPCILIALDNGAGVGSGRSVPGFHLQQALADCTDHLLRSGGHAMAAGLKVERARLDDFMQAFRQHAIGRLEAEMLVKQFEIDAELPLHLVNAALVKALDRLAPFGMGNPNPLFLVNDAQVVGEPRKVGGGERHLSFRIQQGSTMGRAIAFNLADRTEELMSQAGRCSIVFSPRLEEYQGFPQLSLQVKDFCAGRFTDPAGKVT